MPASRSRGHVEEKTAKKTAKPSPRSGVAFPLGAHAGNTGGKKGRSGRPREEIRALLLEGAEVAIPRLRAQLESSDPSVVRSAAEAFLKYGVGTRREIAVEDVRKRVAETLEIIRRHVPPDVVQSMLPELKSTWA